MEVILKQDLPGVGKAGEIVTVADGYARNYLIPRGIAIPATEGNIRALESQRRLMESKRRKQEEKARRLAEKLKNVSCTIKARAGEGDKLFGSVTAAEIAEALKAQGIEVDRKDVLLEEPIKELGVFTVPVRLHKDVTVDVKVWVVKEE